MLTTTCAIALPHCLTLDMWSFVQLGQSRSGACQAWADVLVVLTMCAREVGHIRLSWLLSMRVHPLSLKSDSVRLLYTSCVYFKAKILTCSKCFDCIVLYKTKSCSNGTATSTCGTCTRSCFVQDAATKALGTHTALHALKSLHVTDL